MKRSFTRNYLAESDLLLNCKQPVLKQESRSDVISGIWGSSLSNQNLIISTKFWHFLYQLFMELKVLEKEKNGSGEKSHSRDSVVNDSFSECIEILSVVKYPNSVLIRLSVFTFDSFCIASPPISLYHCILCKTIQNILSNNNNKIKIF